MRGHNPYFNRWFSAIIQTNAITPINGSHNPYFNRWFSAIALQIRELIKICSHNPYFNRWFSAIKIIGFKEIKGRESQSLF